MYLQLDRIKNIGSLPCLEKLILSSNPMCIIPDYRTKVLAQFGDRAAEVLTSRFSFFVWTGRFYTITSTLILLCVPTHIYSVYIHQ